MEYAISLLKDRIEEMRNNGSDVAIKLMWSYKKALKLLEEYEAKQNKND